MDGKELARQALDYRQGRLLKASSAAKVLALTMGEAELEKLARIERVDNPESIAHGQEIDTDPSPALAAAENYRKAHVRVDGMEVSIENPVGSFRHGTAPDGTSWKSEMFADYGYFKGTTGFDKDHVDVFIKPGYAGGAGVVHIVNQVFPDTGEFDEHKCVLGAGSASEAERIYKANYEPGWRGCKSVVARSLEDFKAWVYSSDPGKGELEPYHGWVGVDLDGTLARYDGWVGDTHVGDPVPAMVARVRNWLAAGQAVKLFTARAAGMTAKARKALEEWCEKHIGRVLEITNEKDQGMVALWDDRAVSVKPNAGYAVKAGRYYIPDMPSGLDVAWPRDRLEKMYVRRFDPEEGQVPDDWDDVVGGPAKEAVCLRHGLQANGETIEMLWKTGFILADDVKSAAVDAHMHG